jgi:hypothetical protein
MFAALFFERDPLRFQDLSTGLINWLQDVGGFASFGLLLWLVIVVPRMRAADRASVPSWQRLLFVLFLSAAAVANLVYFGLRGPELIDYLGTIGDPGAQTEPVSENMRTWQSRSLTVAGIFALAAVGLPFLANLSRLRWRRIWALAKLSFKEAVRRRVLYVFSALLLVFLFASWFVPAKSEDQLRTYVQVVYFVMTVLLVLTASLLAAFGIPTDMRLQTIHTVVTKPVERFEIILGRFIGYVSLMAIVLVVMTSLSLLYVVRGVNPDAAEESLKAREPMYGDLTFMGTSKGNIGENVGNEWEYRSYITASRPPQYAIWKFEPPPRRLADRESVRCEITFDIYRTTKGFENRGVNCTFTFATGNFKQGNDAEWRRRRGEEMKKPNRPPVMQIDNQLAEEFGYFELPGKEVVDFHTLSLDVPGGLFKNALKEKEPTPIIVRVKCDSTTQYVGMAKYDLYLRLDDPKSQTDRLLFAVNFFKGAVGILFLICLVVGVAVALSTYLSGVISWLVAMMLLVGGLSQDFIQTVAVGQAQSGGGTTSQVEGPLTSFYRLANREVAASQLEETTLKKAASGSDEVFRWLIRRVVNVVPDVDRFDLTSYVAEGFNIPAAQLGVDFVLLVGYLLPWAVLAFYLLRWREVAGAM